MAKDKFHKQNTMPGVKKKPMAKGAAKSSSGIPKAIGPYKVEGLLDKGGMSLVYLGVHPDSKDPITIKVLAPEFLAEAEVVQRFLQESEIIALADHPNIVKLYGNGRWEGGLYIAMEFIQGISLKHFMTNQSMTLRRALEVTLDIAYALCHLHTHGVVHRDLKPENILMTESGSIKVIDFGIAQLLAGDENSPRSGRGRLMGTPIYMSPEQRENPDSVSFPSDIYSLAIIAYELVLGKLSRGSVQLSLMPKRLRTILAKSLAPRAVDRYQDIVDFISDISAYLNSSALGDEGRGRDRDGGIAETLHAAQTALLPTGKPNWPQVSVGLVTHKIMRASGAYYDFFDLPNGALGLMMVEPQIGGEEGLVYTAVFRGTVRTLAHLTNDPAELADLSNELLCKDPIGKFFYMNYLVLKPQENLLQYISCGFGSLWQCPSGLNTPTRVEAGNPVIGQSLDSQFLAVNQSWNIGDSLVLTSFESIESPSSVEAGFSSEDLKNVFSENILRPPQKLVEAIYHRLVGSAKSTLDQKSASMIALQRQD